jgi:nucleolar protein 9
VRLYGSFRIVAFCVLSKAANLAACFATHSHLTMPKQNKKRGRRSERKRKPEDDLEEQADSYKRTKYDDEEYECNNEEHLAGDFPDATLLDDGENRQSGRIDETPFYGMLDEQESEYFRKTGEMLELNQFNGPEDREDFIRSIHDQLEGKELKLAFSQGTSRVLEKIIKVSTPTQLKKLFKEFSGK